MAKPKRKTLPKDFEAVLRNGDLAALKVVFDGCDVDARGGVFKQTALAFNECPDELTAWLVERGADLSAVDAYGETPLHARAGHWQGQIGILVELGADVHHAASGRGTPLHRAAAVGNIANARILLDHGASTDVLNDAGQTPLAFALQRCSNATIERIAPMAELLLGAMANQPVKAGVLRRLFGRDGTPSSPVTPEMRAQVQRIGADFEFHRANFNPDAVDAASDGLGRLYALFDVPPVPPRVMHDGKSRIIAVADRWQDRHQKLWEQLVPSSGAATTVQGEVIRISGRINDEIEGDGGVNWDADYKRMARAFLGHVGSARPLPADRLEEARALVAGIGAHASDTARMCELAVDWVALNPQPIALPTPGYQR